MENMGFFAYMNKWREEFYVPAESEIIAVTQDRGNAEKAKSLIEKLVQDLEKQPFGYQEKISAAKLRLPETAVESKLARAEDPIDKIILYASGSVTKELAAKRLNTVDKIEIGLIKIYF